MAHMAHIWPNSPLASGDVEHMLSIIPSDSTGEMNTSLHKPVVICRLIRSSHAGWREALVSKPLCCHPLLPLDHWAPAMQRMLVKCPIGMHGVEHKRISPPRLVLQSAEQAQRAAACNALHVTACYQACCASSRAAPCLMFQKRWVMDLVGSWLTPCVAVRAAPCMQSICLYTEGAHLIASHTGLKVEA